MIKRLFILCLALCAWHTAFAHDSPEHEIEALTAQMAVAGKSADLLARRATEWRALGELSKAANDLRAAILLSPRSTALLSELTKVLTLQGKLTDALKTVDFALEVAEHDADRAQLWMVRAEVHERAGRYEQALIDCVSAFDQGSPLPDWCLTRARLQTRCGKFSECAADLKIGHEKTGSAILEVEWIEAMIDAGQSREALARIEPHLARARWRAGWLIRRARALIALGDQTRPKNDLRNALEELERRINPMRPDPTLIVERGLAFALMGSAQAAEEDFARAKELSGSTMAVLRLERALRNQKAPPIISEASS